MGSLTIRNEGQLALLVDCPQMRNVANTVIGQQYAPSYLTEEIIE